MKVFLWFRGNFGLVLEFMMWVLSGILDVSVVFLGVDEAFGFFYSVPIRLAVRSMI